MLLSSVLQRRVEWGRIPANPVRLIRKPLAKRERGVRPLAPATVETMRRWLLDRNAVLLRVLAYAGLRPSEALALTFGDVGERTLLVERSLPRAPSSARRRGKSDRSGCSFRCVRISSPGAETPRR